MTAAAPGGEGSRSHGGSSPIVPEVGWTALPDLAVRLPWTVQAFRRCLAQRGFDELAAVALTARIDPTVRFVGSAMSVFKPLVLERRIPATGVMLAQPALRTRNLQHSLDADHRPRWPSYFLQLGAVAPVTAGETAAAAALAFLDRELPAEPDRLVLRAWSGDDDLLGLHPVDRTVELRGEQDAYRHRYGVPGMVGRTLCYAIRDHDGVLHDVGNLIVVEVDAEMVAVELAFGPSNLLTRIHGLELPIQATSSALAVPLRDWTHVTLADTLAAALALLREGLRPAGSGRHRVARSYLQTLSALRRRLAMPHAKLAACARRFQQAEFGLVDDLPDRMTRYIARFEELEADAALGAPRRNALAARSFRS